MRKTLHTTKVMYFYNFAGKYESRDIHYIITSSVLFQRNVFDLILRHIS